jgi:branched-chain amino acid transport system ATP-binding protein
MLELKKISAGYGKVQVLWDVSIKVEQGEFVAVLGGNGAGKTTTLRTIAGIIKPTSGDILFCGQKINGLDTNEITRLGVSFVTEDGCLFTGMTVWENLMMGAYIIKEKKRIKDLLDQVFTLFPRLEERKSQLAGTMSGGERRMLAIARGLMSSPKILLIDEPSIGLAPQLVLQVFETLKTLKKMGVTILLVEQNVNTTLKITDRAYVIENGFVTLEGKSCELEQNEHIKTAYMGVV